MTTCLMKVVLPAGSRIRRISVDEDGQVEVEFEPPPPRRRNKTNPRSSSGVSSIGTVFSIAIEMLPWGGGRVTLEFGAISQQNVLVETERSFNRGHGR